MQRGRSAVRISFRGALAQMCENAAGSRQGRLEDLLFGPWMVSCAKVSRSAEIKNIQYRADLARSIRHSHLSAA